MGTSHFMAVMNSSDSSRIKGAEITLSWDEQPTKVRKPYTITKQRERWTEEEHQKFLESLKLYGRTWRRIEEHIGTKSAVQIRSHAQKFFSKLGREASASGLLTWGAQDIEIPPPRPKRKPSHPYPRKACSTVSSCPSIEQDTISPSVACSSSNSFENPKHRLQRSPLKNVMYTPSSNQRSFSTLDASNISRASLGSSLKVGSPTSLKLFGQTLSISGAQNGDVSTADKVHLDASKTVKESSIESSLEDSESRGSLASEREEVELSLPCLSSFKIDIEASCGKSRVNFKKSTLHSPGVSLKEENWVQTWKPVGGAGYDRAVLKEDVIHQVFPGPNKDQEAEDQSCLDKQNISIISDSEKQTFTPEVTLSVPLHRFPSLSSGGQSKHCVGNAFTSNLAPSATDFWPCFVQSATGQHETEKDVKAGAAVTAASFTAASVYWSLLKDVQSGVHPKIAVVTTPEKLTSNDLTCMFESVAKVKEQELNHRTNFDWKTQNPDHKHELGVKIFSDDKETVCSKVNLIETHSSKPKSSAKRCCSGPEFMHACLTCDSSGWDTDSKRPRKCVGSSYSVEYGAMKKGSQEVPNDAHLTFNTSMGDSESRGEKLNFTFGADMCCVQTTRNGNAAEKRPAKMFLGSQVLQRNIVHSASNNIGSFNETLCELGSSKREEKSKNVSDQKDISEAWQNQQGNSRQVCTMCRSLDAGDQEFQKMSRVEAIKNVTTSQSQITSLPFSTVQTVPQSVFLMEMATLSSPDNGNNLLLDKVVVQIPSSKALGNNSQHNDFRGILKASEIDNNLRDSFRRSLNASVVSETKVRFSLQKDYKDELRNPKTETGSVKTSCASNVPKMIFGTEHCGSTQFLQSGRSERCDVVKAERDEDLLAGLKVTGGIGRSRYSGVGFVPYKNPL